MTKSLFIDLGLLGELYGTTRSGKFYSHFPVPVVMSVSERETTEAFVIKLQRLQSGHSGAHQGPGLENNGVLFIVCQIIGG